MSLSSAKDAAGRPAHAKRPTTEGEEAIAAKWLGDALKGNRSLEELDLSRSGIRDTSAVRATWHSRTAQSDDVALVIRFYEDSSTVSRACPACGRST